MELEMKLMRMTLKQVSLISNSKCTLACSVTPSAE